jgi:L-lysine 6-transaminase
MFNKISADEVLPILSQVILTDGFKFTLDLEKSNGSYIYDSSNNRKVLDFFSYFATNPLGHNHPGLTKDEDFKKDLLAAAIANPSNSDFYTTQYANFIETFKRVAMPEPFKHAFFISGGTLAVENALKVAMDWKVRKNFAKGIKKEKGFQIIHFKEAFHGRSGYTMSLTNSKPVYTDYYAKFKWPRIDNPKIIFPMDKSSEDDVKVREEKALEQIKKAIIENMDDVCAIIIEPIQSEGGDNHFRKEFFQSLRKIADENELLLIFDEVQNGVGLTGKFWAYQHFGMVPDIVAFGKKMQICGIIATGKVDEIADNCFRVKGRINSTWGGNLSDMVRATQILRIIERDKLVENAAVEGAHLLMKINELAGKRKITNPRGRGLQCAFDLQDSKTRDTLIEKALKNNLLILGAGEKAIRFRPFLTVSKEEINEAFELLDKTLAEMDLKPVMH